LSGGTKIEARQKAAATLKLKCGFLSHSPIFYFPSSFIIPGTSPLPFAVAKTPVLYLAVAIETHRGCISWMEIF